MGFYRRLILTMPATAHSTAEFNLINICVLTGSGVNVNVYKVEGRSSVRGGLDCPYY
jgi:hypothetical protein